MGERLAEARDLFKYKRDNGGFRGWYTERLGMTETRVYALISIYEKIGGMSPELGRLSREALFETASAPEPVRQQVEQLLIDGEPVTAADIWTFGYHPKATWD